MSNVAKKYKDIHMLSCHVLNNETEKICIICNCAATLQENIVRLSHTVTGPTQFTHKTRYARFLQYYSFFFIFA